MGRPTSTHKHMSAHRSRQMGNFGKDARDCTGDDYSKGSETEITVQQEKKPIKFLAKRPINTIPCGRGANPMRPSSSFNTQAFSVRCAGCVRACVCVSVFLYSLPPNDNWFATNQLSKGLLGLWIIGCFILSLAS